ncbi:MAG: tRNA-dihydrouridine synthase family protein [Parabacteroides sp.]|nr:tRNA-dihydrouridine synthase family protein [Parabacteroides sp.]
MTCPSDSYRIYFAPLQGYTDAIYRNVHARIFGGVEAYYTPFVRLEGGKFRNKDVHDIDPEANQAPVIPQLLAGNAEELGKIAALFASKGYTHADINMGCPFVPIARKHKGAGLLPYPDEAAALFEALKKFSDMTFSLKMRLGWDNPEEALNLLPLINETDFTSVTVHARIGTQQYKGVPDLDAFEKFYKECTHPLYYNGDLLSASDITAVTTRFPKLEGVVIGRGLLANPALALEYKNGAALNEQEKQEKLRQFHSELFALYQARMQGDAQLLGKLKTIWEYLLPDADRKCHKKIKKSSRIDRYTEAVNELFEQYHVQ